MTINSDMYFSEFKTFKKITDPKERERVKKEINNPYILTGMDRLRAFYSMMDLEFDDEFFNNILDEFPISE